MLHVTTASAIGGAERLLTDVLNHMPPEIQSSVCTLSPAGDLQEELSAIGVESIALGFHSRRAAPRVLLHLCRHLATVHYDVVHTHLVHASALGLLAARLTQTPVATMTRHYGQHVSRYGTTADRVLDRVSNALAHRVFAISESVRDVLVEREGVSADRVDVVPNGVDADRVRRQAGPRLARSNPALRIVTVASLHPTKGHLVLLDAARELRDSGWGIEVVLVGGGILESTLRHRVQKLGLRSVVRFAGYILNPYVEMVAGDIYVQPSLDEGFGISVLEAMALELPVIASAVGGLPEIIADGTSGLLVPPGDSAALAAGIRRLGVDQLLRERLAHRGRAVVETSFAARDVAYRYAQAYEELLGERPRGSWRKA